MRRSLLLLPLALCLATSVLAADDPLEFGKSPAKWLMTREEEQAWRAVKTADEARVFADLFWARRDPTPGTLANEFRADVEGRIQFSDRSFAEGKLRGALTERGRVIVTLGYPSNLGNEGSRYLKQAGAEADPFGGRQYAGRSVWVWEHKDAVKYQMPRIEVVFIHDKQGGGARRDPQRSDFISAMPRAIRQAIVSPDLTEVPAWAKPQAPQIVTVPSTVVMKVETTEASATAATPAATAPPGQTLRGASAGQALPKSAGKLTLVKDAFALNAQGKKDPFGGLTSIETYKPGDELNFVAEYCAGILVEELTGVTVQARISGMINGEKVNMTGPVDDLIPDSIKASPGCHLVRGAIPLEGVDPGQYTLTMSIASGADKYNLTREFRVE
jgi:GWxTD domain-containing protein